jgi:uncharacterized protein YmfQ (DUF2313 family)
MARSLEQYVEIMLSMLPHGDAWPRDPNSETGQRFAAIAAEFVLIDQRNDQLLREMMPSTTVELLPDWETDHGLPDPCIVTAQTFTERRNALINKYRFIGAQDQQFFIDVAIDLGYTITISEYSESIPGPQSEYEGISLAGDAWNYVWQINAEDNNIVRKQVGTPTGEPLSTWGNEGLECALRSLAHDHRILFFTYT